ncbi:hypothetical protein EHS25_007607 [Saitozyma podzolica]|uniref:Uncharacterized protein n=1 Tax=Saitozyma podzolica TaxID=1890683 RepID=A0A427YQ82_9TREE|nr:hypothetical protein EHS25_007607 [Saitozyma podzolica]
MASDKRIVSFAGGIVGDPDKTAALIIRRIQSDRLNIRDDHVLCPIYELHHDMINDLYRNGHVVHGLFADCLAMANSKTEGQAYTNKWQEIADNIRNLPALKAKISNVKQEEDGKAEAPAHLLRLLKPAIPPNPTPAAVATYDSDEMLQLWLALRARGVLEIFHRRTKGKHLGPIIPGVSSKKPPVDYSHEFSFHYSLFGCEYCNVEASVLLFYQEEQASPALAHARRGDPCLQLYLQEELAWDLLNKMLKYEQADIAAPKGFNYTCLKKLDDKAAAQKEAAP